MLDCRTLDLKSERDKISEAICNWSLGKEKALNVVSPPYSSSIIFIKTVLKYASLDKNILYITGEREENINLISNIKKYTNFRSYSILRNGVEHSTSVLCIANYKNSIRLKDKFDLVIYNDLDSFPEYSNLEIIDLLIKCVKEEGKLISCAIESIFKNQKEILMPARENRRPLTEPRYIITRLDLNKDLPYVIYDYLKFSINSSRRVIVYVPNKEKVEKLYNYLNNLRNELCNNIMYFIREESSEKVLSKFINIKKAIIVTDDYSDVYENLKDTDVIVYSTDDKIFDYKKLVYFCGKVGRNEKSNRGEVIFLANEESEHMDKAKEIARNFNKEAWEMGLLNI